MGFIVSAMLWASSLMVNLSTFQIHKGEVHSPCPTSYHVHIFSSKRPNVHRKVATPISQDQLFDVLEASHVRVFGNLPKASKLTMAWAQVSLENGRGKYVYNNNIGNIGPIKKSDQDRKSTRLNSSHRT